MCFNTKFIDCSVFKFDGKNNFEPWKIQMRSFLLVYWCLGCCKKLSSRVSEYARNKSSQEKK